MKVAFTICSNNYLAQAKTLGDSLIDLNPDYIFIIGLVDKKSHLIDYSLFNPHSVLLLEDIEIKNLPLLISKYNIIELNTAVKASFFKYIINQYKGLDFIFYFDPDIQIFTSLKDLEQDFVEADILVTPHIITPVPMDDNLPGENTFLNFGIYNLGFLGIKNSQVSLHFLNWWESRTLTSGYMDTCNGYFVDQLWINLVPIYYPKTLILRSYGYNAGPWNLHERKNLKLLNKEKGYEMEDGSVLSFYHFSSYNYECPEMISKYYNRYNFENCPNLKLIYTPYHNLLINNKIDLLSKIKCFYVEEKEKLNKKIEEKKVRYDFVKSLIPPVIWNLGKALTLKFVSK